MTDITVKKLELTTMQDWRGVIETVITALLEKLKMAQPMDAVALSMEIQKWYAMDYALEYGAEPGLTNAATCELVRELERRLGVKKVVVNPYEKKKVAVEGAAIVLVVED